MPHAGLPHRRGSAGDDASRAQSQRILGLRPLRDSRASACRRLGLCRRVAARRPRATPAEGPSAGAPARVSSQQGPGSSVCGWSEPQAGSAASADQLKMSHTPPPTSSGRALGHGRVHRWRALDHGLVHRGCDLDHDFIRRGRALGHSLVRPGRVLGHGLGLRGRALGHGLVLRGRDHVATASSAVDASLATASSAVDAPSAAASFT